MLTMSTFTGVRSGTHAARSRHRLGRKVDSDVSCPYSRNTRQPPCMQTKLSITFSLERSSNESDILESDLAHVALFIICHLCHHVRCFLCLPALRTDELDNVIKFYTPIGVPGHKG